jgi:hypothetical protein
VSDKAMERRLSAYEIAFAPAAIANIVVKVETDGS